MSFLVSTSVKSDTVLEATLETLGKFTYTNLKDFEQLSAFSLSIEYLIGILKAESTSEGIACIALKTLGVLAFRNPK